VAPRRRNSPASSTCSLRKSLVTARPKPEIKICKGSRHDYPIGLSKGGSALIHMMPPAGAAEHTLAVRLAMSSAIGPSSAVLNPGMRITTERAQYHLWPDSVHTRSSLLTAARSTLRARALAEEAASPTGSISANATLSACPPPPGTPTSSSGASPQRAAARDLA
jgi:hypothetical protein